MLSEYLLRWRPEDDKSAFLARAGYTSFNIDRLTADLREQILRREAEFLHETEYGQKYRIRGTLTGPNGRVVRVVTIWMKEEATTLTKFVTLFLDRL